MAVNGSSENAEVSKTPANQTQVKVHLEPSSDHNPRVNLYRNFKVP